MKSFAPLLALASVIVASPLIDSEQLPLDGVEHARFNLEELGTYPGVSLDLNERRLIELEDHRIQLVTELDKINLKAQGVHFFDITETHGLGSSLRAYSKYSYHSPNATSLVKPVIKKLSTKGPQENLRKFTSFRTRFAQLLTRA
ncbi:hypothetical protein EIP86_008734 [Pleurotus ostreatoroseus]|nr:hypothetical protein EIP86_008734 [Pleurotus ostreatoroseus]